MAIGKIQIFYLTNPKVKFLFTCALDLHESKNFGFVVGNGEIRY